MARVSFSEREINVAKQRELLLKSEPAQNCLVKKSGSSSRKLSNDSVGVTYVYQYQSYSSHLKKEKVG